MKVERRLKVGGILVVVKVVGWIVRWRLWRKKMWGGGV